MQRRKTIPAKESGLKSSPNSGQSSAVPSATVVRHLCGTSPFDKYWINWDCCGLFCAAMTYGLHIYGCYSVTQVLLPPWMSTKVDGVRSVSIIAVHIVPKILILCLPTAYRIGIYLSFFFFLPHSSKFWPIHYSFEPMSKIAFILGKVPFYMFHHSGLPSRRISFLRHDHWSRCSASWCRTLTRYKRVRCI